MRETNQTEERDDAPKRVALLILELSVGGAEKALFQLATTLDRERFSPVVYSLSGRVEDLERSLAPELRARGIEVVEFGLRSALGTPLALWRLRRRLRKDRVAVLQCFMFHANILGRFAGRLAGVPVVCAGIRVAERDAPRRLALDRLTRGLVDAWVCVGDAVAKFTRERIGVAENRVVSIPNGIAPPPTASGRTKTDSRRRMIAVGRLTRQKGFDWLLEHADAWLTPEIRRDWTLWIVGDGEDREKLERIALERELGDFVRFCGWREDAKELIADSDLFLLPSRWEGMPNALLEAAAAGRATLCANVEGVAEILGDAEAQICKPGDVEKWRVKLLRLTTDAALRDGAGERNRRRVLELFDVASTTKSYENLWTRLLKEKNL